VGPAIAPVVSGLVLAGGKGDRVGGADKGWLAYRGEPLIRHTSQRLQPQVAGILISANRNLERYRALGYPVVVDDPRFGQFAGPLAGICAAFRVATTDWLAVVPCDAPWLASDLVRRLAAQAPGTRAAVACVEGRMQPAFCLVHRDHAASLDAFLASGGRKVARWLRAIDAVTVDFEDAAPFANLNHPADFESHMP